MKLQLFLFDKRINSMKNPVESGIAPLETDCLFKEKTSIENPVLELNTTNLNIYIYNYCYLVDIGRFYWIDEVISVSNSVLELHCSIDVLATFKTQILSQSSYVLYSSSNYDDLLTDTRIPMQSDSTWTHDEEDTIFTDYDLDTTVVFATIGAIETDENIYGGYNYYVVTERDWVKFLGKLSNSPGLWDDIKNYFADVADSIIFARRYPIPMSEYNKLDPEPVKIAKIEVNFIATRLANLYIHPTPIELTVPNFRSDFLKWEPYTKYMLYFPYVGCVDIPTSEYGKDFLLDYVLNLATGLMNLNVCARNIRNAFNTYTSEVGEMLPITTNQTNISSAISAGTGAVAWGAGAVMSGSAVMGISAIMMAANAVTSALSTTSKQHGMFGGSRDEKLQTKAVLFKWIRAHAMPITELTELYGRPLCRVVQLSTLTGYCKTQEFHFEGNMHKNIIEKIEEMMDGGVYIE